VAHRAKRVLRMRDGLVVSDERQAGLSDPPPGRRDAEAVAS